MQRIAIALLFAWSALTPTQTERLCTSHTSLHSIPKVKIFTATRTLHIGDNVADQNVVLEEWPQDRIPNGAIHDASELNGKRTVCRVCAGQPVLRQDLLGQNEGVWTGVTATDDSRIVAIEAYIDSEVIDAHVERLDLVVLVTYKEKQRYKTILQDVDISAMRSGPDPTEDTKTVWLVVRPEDWAMIRLAESLGILQLIRRQ